MKYLPFMRTKIKAKMVPAKVKAGFKLKNAALHVYIVALYAYITALQAYNEALWAYNVAL